MFETPMGPLLAVIALSYLFGAIPFAYLYFRFVRGVRLTEAGTGTIGIINSFAVGGVAATAVTVLGEISKAAMAGVFAFNVGDGSVPTILAAVFAAFIGTNYSVFLKGRGGKGATVLLWGQGFITFWVPITVGIIAGLLLLVSKWWIEIKRGWVLFIAPLGYIAT